jgi:chromosome segregation protein
LRLNSIKLSGFKSFAEPTTFQLPGQLVGVVGPNGCGKSNIMDAVRWVLGESKASELRGESMQDVIFNGTGSRKPASRASVELVFDNADHRAGGQWNQFTEIAVKRVLTRDGTSSYYINNQPVRRRDVQDVFLGTGLGPRAYAIIGQGTISRIIESRARRAAPVPGRSRRRLQVQGAPPRDRNRLKDTRENLTRVEDILRELNSQPRQAGKAGRGGRQYRGLQDQGTLKLHQLWFLKHRDAASEEERVQPPKGRAVNALEARMADLRHVEAELETMRQAHYAARRPAATRQGLLAEASAGSGRLEERIRYVVEGRQRVEQRLADLKAQNAQWASARKRPAELENSWPGQIAWRPTSRPSCWPPRPKSRPCAARPGRRPAPGARPRQPAARQRGQVQQQIQVLAADSRNIDEQSRQLKTRRERLAADRNGSGRARRSRAGRPTCAASGRRRRGRRNWPTPAARAAGPGARAGRRPPRPRRPSTARAPSQADLSARAWRPCARCRRRCRPRASSSPGWPSTAWTACRACGPHPHRARLGNRAGSRAARAPERAGSGPPGHGARLCRRCAAGQAGLLQRRRTRPAASTHQTLPRLADLLRLGDAGLKRCWATGWKASTPPSP